MTPDHRKDAPSPHGPPTPTVASSWRTVARALRPRLSRAQLTAGVLSALLGFALVVQVQANRDVGLAGLRQDELVRILDEVTQRSDELEREAADLRRERSELVTGSDTQRAAQEAAEERAVVQGILAGTLPAEGPGIELTLTEPQGKIPAHVLYNVLEELRNAGAEAIQLNDVRVTASTYVIETEDGVEVDGRVLEAPYRWRVIGDPGTLTTALDIPGGALASVRNASGRTNVTTPDLVEVEAIKEARVPEHATPVPPESTD
ncbi:DUF881 domain-containing protein [Cellulomonas sp. APG4]|uniref:DUF881 domain-containing protein n=1 Tax=Cellulomonas sp. APG4 TaxID=1538656 RepID=UPI00137ABC48|nr:DUF881 domain-containing protein [Cellulomonas sp. APG4]NCT90746.1 DUF881 domain-containing protein [Cellulomonas sp. APG4]